GARAALTLTLVVSVLLVAGIDMTLYLAPFLALQALVFGWMRRGLRATLGRAARAAAVIVPAVVATNLYQLLPYVHGIRASWMSSGSLFHLEDFTARSLDAFPSLVGDRKSVG